MRQTSDTNSIWPVTQTTIKTLAKHTDCLNNLYTENKQPSHLELSHKPRRIVNLLRHAVVVWISGGGGAAAAGARLGRRGCPTRKYGRCWPGRPAGRLGHRSPGSHGGRYYRRQTATRRPRRSARRRKPSNLTDLGGLPGPTATPPDKHHKHKRAATDTKREQYTTGTDTITRTRGYRGPF